MIEHVRQYYLRDAQAHLAAATKALAMAEEPALAKRALELAEDVKALRGEPMKVEA